jgi:hypothetical protein
MLDGTLVRETELPSALEATAPGCELTRSARSPLWERVPGWAIDLTDSYGTANCPPRLGHCEQTIGSLPLPRHNSGWVAGWLVVVAGG